MPRLMWYIVKGSVKAFVALVAIFGGAALLVAAFVLIALAMLAWRT